MNRIISGVSVSPQLPENLRLQVQEKTVGASVTEMLARGSVDQLLNGI